MAGTEQPGLSLSRFSALVEAYGGDFERFPKHERAAARELALASVDAQRMLEAARALDDILVAARRDLPSVELEHKLVRIPSLVAQDRSVVRLLPFRTHARAGLAAAAAVLLGLVGGQWFDSDLDLGDAAQLTSEQADIAGITFADGLLSDLGFDADSTTSEGAE